MIRITPLLCRLGIVGQRSYFTPNTGIYGASHEARENYQELIRKGFCLPGDIELLPGEKQTSIGHLFALNSVVRLLKNNQFSVKSMLSCDVDTLNRYAAHVIACDADNKTPSNLIAFQKLDLSQQHALTKREEPYILDTPAAASCGK